MGREWIFSAMMKCFSHIDVSLKEFYKANKNYGDYTILAQKMVLFVPEVNHYYGIVDEYDKQTVVKCINTKPLTFISESGIPGPLKIVDILWEKSPEEMFKPDCCNG